MSDPDTSTPAGPEHHLALVPGNRCVRLSHRSMGPNAVYDDVIDRVLKRDVVLKSGERFNRNTLRQRAASAWSPGDRLLHPDHPAAVQAREEQDRYFRHRRIRSLLGDAIEALIRENNEAVAAAKIRGALDALEATE